MTTPDQKIMFLTLIIALSAYIASIRFALIESLRSPKIKKRETRKRVLVGLIPADLPLVFAGIFLTIDLFLKDMINVDPPSFFYSGSVWLFSFAVLVLAIHHFLSWLYTLNKENTN